jgi:hypothetical protein
LPRFGATGRGGVPTGSSATQGRLYVTWCVSPPPDPTAQYHQTLYAAVIRP